MKPQELIDKLEAAESIGIQGESWLITRVDVTVEYAMNALGLPYPIMTTDVELKHKYSEDTAEAKLTHDGSLHIMVHYREIPL